MRYNTLLLMLVAFATVMGSSCQTHKKDINVFRLYENNFSNMISPSKETGVTKYIVKAYNQYDTPILIPFTTYHQIPNGSLYKSTIRNDSIADITFYGGAFIAGLGWDTLYSGETQSFFWEPPLEKAIEKLTAEVVSFKYYFLDDMNEDKNDEDIVKQEFTFLLKHPKGDEYIFKPVKGFNPYYDNSYPIPGSILQKMKEN